MHIRNVTNTKKTILQGLVIVVSMVILHATAFSQTVNDCPFCNLAGKSFAGKDLAGVNFSGAILDGADFSNCKLNGAIFSNSSLVKANFTNAQLGVSPSGPANFSGANLSYANFNGAFMKGAILQYTNNTGTDFSNADLTSSLPGLQLNALTTGKATLPNFTNAKLSCEYKRFTGSVIDFNRAIFPQCDGQRMKQPSFSNKRDSIISQKVPPDSTQPTEVLVSVMSDPVKTRDSAVKDKDIQQSLQKKSITLAGTAGSIIYVSTNGTDNSGCGSIDNPCKTINQAVVNVPVSGTIAVDYGQYSFNVIVNIQKSITIVGGYSDGEPTSYQSQLTAAANGMPLFNITGSGVRVNLSNLIMNGSIATDNNKASIVMSVGNEGMVALQNVNINAATGGAGKAGAGATPGSDGGAGGAGNANKDGAGGKGGVSACGGNSGGAGGKQATNAGSSCDYSWFTCTADAKYYKYSGGYGQPGNTGYSAMGSAGANAVNYQCGSTQRPTTPASGGNGIPGGCGLAGISATNITGSFQNGSWVAAVSGTGGAGLNGSGGGGGGSGGPCHYCDCVCGNSFYTGTAGGGGGSGGCGAPGAGGGTQGGASFGIVLFSSSCILDNTVKITGGAGGYGGQGGSGNSGGKGGAAGAAQAASNVCNSTGGQGGAGGSGGAGGASGGGAGGNGGPSVCIAMQGASSLTGTATFYPGISGNYGLGGYGGNPCTGATCYAASGQNGKAGQVASTLQY